MKLLPFFSLKVEKLPGRLEYTEGINPSFGFKKAYQCEGAF